MNREIRGSSFELPAGYYLERDPDVLVLRRIGGIMVGAFSARGAAPEAVGQMVEEIAREEPRALRPGARSADIALPLLRARFFGRFEVLYGDENVALGRNGKALAILKYLLVHRTRPVSQDHLMGWLWPESNLKKARWSLNSAIHVLRKLLSNCSSAGGQLVLLEEGQYRLSPLVRVSADVDDFDDRYERGRCLEREGRPEEAATEYERAIELYRDNYLIEDLYEDWTMVERERLSNAFLDMLDRLAAHYMESGQYQESIRACYRILEKDLCHEDSHRMLMRCYARLGLRARALRQYHLCEEMLNREYGTVPSSETRALRQAITAGGTRVDARS